MAAYDRIISTMRDGGVVLLDGATGTELERRGAEMDPHSWCGAASADNASLLGEIHTDYIDAGARIITANTFASSRLMLEGAGLGDRVAEINTIAVEAALGARDRHPSASEVVVAGSLSHMVPVSEGTDRFDPNAVPSEDRLAEAFGELAGVLASSGAELILLEMMYEPARARIALDAALATGLPVWFDMSARRSENGQVVAFHPFEELPLADLLGLLPDAGVDAVGVMHTQSQVIGDAIDEIRALTDLPIAAYPDSGFFKMPSWQFHEVISPADLEEYFVDWISRGATALGGCCGLTVEHVLAAAAARDRV
ncbi:MAG: homocysteine S-methyltransferase family protein [Actinobacteria bacterium]|jgi:methionine synthase I (cobalamin-dependent)|nr:homocysteine S-methyltransferase family protein [Actinomycetota bacterium]